jgi:hypothetical protein
MQSVENTLSLVLSLCEVTWVEPDEMQMFVTHVGQNRPRETEGNLLDARMPIIHQDFPRASRMKEPQAVLRRTLDDQSDLALAAPRILCDPDHLVPVGHHKTALAPSCALPSHRPTAPRLFVSHQSVSHAPRPRIPREGWWRASFPQGSAPPRPPTAPSTELPDCRRTVRIVHKASSRLRAQPAGRTTDEGGNAPVLAQWSE